MNQNRENACLGMLGGLVYMIGDSLLYVYPGRNALLDIDPVFAQMPVWRFIVSAFCGVFGMALMAFGFCSLYAMTKNVCGRKMQRFMILGGIGVASSCLGHFGLGSLLPMTYKAVIASGGTAAMAQQACEQMDAWILPVNLVIVILLYVQLIVLLYMILSRRSGLPRWYALIPPVGAVLFGAVWYLIFHGTALAGVWGSSESLCEGLMYLAAYLYWKKQNDLPEEGNV